MIEQLFSVGIALVFLLVGYFLGRSGHKVDTERIQPVSKIPQKNALIRGAVKAGIIEYPTQEDIDYVESGEEKVDEAREKVFRENFKI